MERDGIEKRNKTKKKNRRISIMARTTVSGADPIASTITNATDRPTRDRRGAGMKIRIMELMNPRVC